jgi:hypothetical protein
MPPGEWVFFSETGLPILTFSRKLAFRYTGFSETGIDVRERAGIVGPALSPSISRRGRGGSGCREALLYTFTRRTLMIVNVCSNGTSSRVFSRGSKGSSTSHRIVLSSTGPTLVSPATPPSSSRSRCVSRPTKLRFSVPAGEVALVAPLGVPPSPTVAPT